jgi:uncharacterized membrane protein
MEKIIPTISILLNIGSAIGYIAFVGNWKMASYFACAAWLNIVVVYLLEAK